MARPSRRKDPGALELQMTPMIDVVFQLLIFFIVTLKTPDISAHLDIFRPAAGAPPDTNVEPPKMIQIKIFKGALVMNDRNVTIETLGSVLMKLAELSKTQTIMIVCARDSEHDMLIRVLDLCARAGLANLSVSSMN